MADPSIDKPTDSPPSLAVAIGVAFAAYQDGQRARMGDVVRLATPVLWHTVRAYRLDAQTAEDVIQSTWLALVRHAESVKDPRAVLQWLIVTARREAWRVSGTQARTESVDWEAPERPDLPAPSDQQPEATALRDDEQQRLWTHIQRLDERCQRLLRVIAFADHPDYAQIATSLGMPVGSIGPTRGRCLAKLRFSLTNDAQWEPR